MNEQEEGESPELKEVSGEVSRFGEEADVVKQVTQRKQDNHMRERDSMCWLSEAARLRPTPSVDGRPSGVGEKGK
jgi:hypothetical protein